MTFLSPDLRNFDITIGTSPTLILPEDISRGRTWLCNDDPYNLAYIGLGATSGVPNCALHMGVPLGPMGDRWTTAWQGPIYGITAATGGVKIIGASTTGAQQQTQAVPPSPAPLPIALNLGSSVPTFTEFLFAPPSGSTRKRVTISNPPPPDGWAIYWLNLSPGALALSWSATVPTGSVAPANTGPILLPGQRVILDELSPMFQGYGTAISHACKTNFYPPLYICVQEEF